MPLYRALLRLYPASWRAEYEREMCSVFASRRAAASNALGTLALWLETLPDLFMGAAAVHLDILRQDLHYAIRTLRRSPGFALTAVAITAFGIGATTAAFTMLDHVLIRPLPFAHQDRLVKVYEDHPVQSCPYCDVAPANYNDWKHLSQSFSSLGAFRNLSVNLTGQGEPRTLDGAAVSAEILPMLGVQPALGRSFAPQDDRPFAPGTVILSHGLWQTVFGGDSAVLGRTIRLYELPYTVIGVMPANFYFPSRQAQLWTTLRFGPTDFQDRSDTYIFALGLLKPEVSVARARAEMRTVAARMSKAYPQDLSRIGASVRPIREEVSSQALLMLKVLLGAALCVLLIACTNLASLLLARALVRRREIAVRTALGAGRERLIRQTLTESSLIAVAGGALGLVLARASLPLLVLLIPVSLPIAELPSIDPSVLLFTFLLTCFTGILFGMVPALRVYNSRNAPQLHEGGRSGMGGRQERLRSTLVAAEVAGTVVLLIGFGLLTRALWRIQSVDPGFAPENVLTLRTALPMPRYEKPSVRDPFYEHVLGEARRLPGVTAAGYTSFLPMVNRGGIWPVAVEGQPEEPSARRPVSLRMVTPGFFAAMGIPLLQGRDIAESDTATAPYVALVSQSFVRRHWAGQNPLGRRIGVGNNLRVIAGVVGDVRVRGLERPSEPQVYVSWRQANGVSPWYAPKDLVLRSSGDPAALLPSLTRIVHEADPAQPISNVAALASIVEGETASRRVQLYALGAFGAIAFLLAGVGIHGLLSFAVASRTQEIGVRIAMGARPGDILRLTLGESFRLAVIGIAAGFALAFAAGRLLESLLAGVQRGDLATFAASAALCLVMTLAGSLAPAMRALRIHPATALRGE